MRSGEVEVDDERDNVLSAKMEDVSRRDCECRIECRIDGGGLESCLSPKGEVTSFLPLMVSFFDQSGRM